MKYTGLPSAMWMLYKKSFRNHLISDLGFSEDAAGRITKRAKPKYREIIEKLPELTGFYEAAMTMTATKVFCKKAGKIKFTDKDVEGMKATAALKAADRNPYSWNMEYLPYDDGSGYEARFTKCGICELMKEYGFYDLVPAMCHLDYTMSELGGASTFVRKFTLASGGPYCECGYKKKD